MGEKTEARGRRRRVVGRAFHGNEDTLWKDDFTDRDLSSNARNRWVLMSVKRKSTSTFHVAILCPLYPMNVRP